MILQNSQLVWSNLGPLEARSCFHMFTRMADSRIQTFKNSISATVEEAVPCLFDADLIPLYLGDKRVRHKALVFKHKLTRAYLIMKDTGTQNTLFAKNSADRTNLESLILRELDDFQGHFKPKENSLIPRQFTYLYFNNTNRAIQHYKDYLQLNSLDEYLLELKRVLRKNTSECFFKTSSDQWIAGNKVLDREIYYMATRKDLSLAEMDDEIKKIKMNHFSKIFAGV